MKLECTAVENRYLRQTILPEIGSAGQQKLADASVLCIGAGGLGSPALLYLAAAGIGRIGICEFDTVDESNLQRQILFSTADVGKEKAKVAQEKLQALNPDISVDTYGQLNAENIDNLFKNYDIILDGTDNFAAKYLINDAAVKYKKPLVYGAIQQFDGYVSVFDSAHGPCYRCLYPEPPQTQINNCSESGIIGGVAGIVGVTQALQVVEIIVGHRSFNTLVGKLWVLDAKTMQTHILHLTKNNNCPVCSQKPEDIRLDYTPPVCESKIAEITVTEVRNKEFLLLIDVREDEEWADGHIDAAQHWSLSKMKEGSIPPLDKNVEIILHCQKGGRSLQAAQILKEHGYSNVYSMAGGYEAWLE